MCIHLKNYEIPVSRRIFRKTKHLSNKYRRLLDCVFPAKYEYNSPSIKQKALERVPESVHGKVCVTKWFYITTYNLYWCNTVFSVFTLKKKGKKKAGTEQNRQRDWGVARSLRARQLNTWNGELNSLCCLPGSKRNSPSRAPQTRSLSEAATAETPSRSYTFLTVSLSLLPDLLSREITTPCISQGFEVSVRKTTGNHRQNFHQRAPLVTAYCSLYPSPLPRRRGCAGLRGRLAPHLPFGDLTLHFSFR